LYKKLLHKYNFGQAHSVELLIRVHAKFTLNFLDLPTSSSQISKFETISGIYLNKKEKKKLKQRMVRIWPMASVLRAWRPAERGCPGPLASPAPDRSGSASAVRPEAEAARLGLLTRCPT
jgi:hypothetical protein